MIAEALPTRARPRPARAALGALVVSEALLAQIEALRLRQRGAAPEPRGEQPARLGDRLGRGRTRAAKRLPRVEVDEGAGHG
ncbi:MAG TPA: hypothetical protein VNJ46_05190, partial [Gaiellaceae bacterium]|nr:hypothetical protein [Gaiellaceae bacterium]